jgi:hypothetical protein
MELHRKDVGSSRIYTRKVSSAHLPEAPLHTLPYSSSIFATWACSLSISGEATMAWGDVNQPRAEATRTNSSGRSCAAAHRRLAGGGIGVATGGR